MTNIKEEVLKELWGFDESARDDESLSFDYDDVVDAIDLTQQKIIEEFKEMIKKHGGVCDYCKLELLEELKKQVEKAK